MVRTEKRSSRGLERCSPIVIFFFAANTQSPQQILYWLPIISKIYYPGLRNHELVHHDAQHRPLMISAVEVKSQQQKNRLYVTVSVEYGVAKHGYNYCTVLLYVLFCIYCIMSLTLSGLSLTTVSGHPNILHGMKKTNTKCPELIFYALSHWETLHGPLNHLNLKNCKWLIQFCIVELTKDTF